jgi:AhpD family alkylhydroperoxidase
MTGDVPPRLPHMGWQRNLRGGAPDVMKAFSGIAQTALAPKALDAKTKELIALGIGIAIRCDDCIAFHIKAAVERGATREECKPCIRSTTAV